MNIFNQNRSIMMRISLTISACVLMLNNQCKALVIQTQSMGMAPVINVQPLSLTEILLAAKTDAEITTALAGKTAAQITSALANSLITAEKLATILTIALKPNQDNIRPKAPRAILTAADVIINNNSATQITNALLAAKTDAEITTALANKTAAHITSALANSLITAEKLAAILTIALKPNQDNIRPKAPRAILTAADALINTAATTPIANALLAAKTDSEITTALAGKTAAQITSALASSLITGEKLAVTLALASKPNQDNIRPKAPRAILGEADTIITLARDLAALTPQNPQALDQLLLNKSDALLKSALTLPNITPQEITRLLSITEGITTTQQQLNQFKAGLYITAYRRITAQGGTKVLRNAFLAVTTSDELNALLTDKTKFDIETMLAMKTYSINAIDTTGLTDKLLLINDRTPDIILSNISSNQKSKIIEMLVNRVSGAQTYQDLLKALPGSQKVKDEFSGFIAAMDIKTLAAKIDLCFENNDQALVQFFTKINQGALSEHLKHGPLAIDYLKQQINSFMQNNSQKTVLDQALNNKSPQTIKAAYTSLDANTQKSLLTALGRVESFTSLEKIASSLTSQPLTKQTATSTNPEASTMPTIEKRLDASSTTSSAESQPQVTPAEELQKTTIWLMQYILLDQSPQSLNTIKTHTNEVLKNAITLVFEVPQGDQKFARILTYAHEANQPLENIKTVLKPLDSAMLKKTYDALISRTKHYLASLVINKSGDTYSVIP